MKHIFLDMIFEYDLPEINNGDFNLEYGYDRIKGYWVDKEGNPCIFDPNFSKPRTKKADIETGEDLKGE